MTETEQIIMNRLEALALDWKRNPAFKAMCKVYWDEDFFNEVEEKVNKLLGLKKIENKKPETNKFLDISEINVEGW